MRLDEEDTWPGIAPVGPARAPIRILLVDDSEDFRRQSIRFLSAAPHCLLVAFASSGQEAVELERRIAPDLVLMDLKMPGIDGFEAARRIKARQGAARIVMMTLDASSYRNAPEAAIADGFVSKVDFIGELGFEIRRLFFSAESGDDAA